MINSFKGLLNRRQNEIRLLIDKYANGYDKIVDTEGKVDGMKTVLIEMQPQLVKAKEETEAKIVVVTKEKEQADKLKAVVLEEASVVQVAVDEATAIKEDCLRDLEKAMPALESAQNALKVLDPREINTLKGFQ